MRLAVLTTVVKVVQPGSSVTWDVEVVNDGPVIEGVVCRIPELGDDLVSVLPRELPLFPGETGKLAVTVNFPDGFPAGKRTLVVTVTTTVTDVTTSGGLLLEVLPRAAAAMALLPEVQRARRTATYSLTYTNRGNEPLNVALTGVDPDRSMRYAFSQSTLQTQPGESASIGLTVRHRRILAGGEIGRPFQVVSDGDGLDLSINGTLRQRPLVPRGVLTIVALVLIVGLWATAFLVGLNAAYSSDALTKTAPASFFLTTSQQQGLAADTVAGDVVPKQGILAPGVGGSISGAVRAVSTGRAVGRITVQAWRPTRTGLQLVTSAASQSDGTYSLRNLFPGDYKLRFEASGYREVWFPTASSSAGAVAVTVGPGTVTPAIDVPIAGLPGSISGEIDPGEATKPLTITVTARSLLALTPGPPITVTATKNAPGSSNDGEYSYTLPALTTPNTYRISVAAAGYTTSLTSDDVPGGKNRSEPTVRLSAGTTVLSGTVTDGKAPLGGVTVTVTANNQVFTKLTPTTGNGVGTFTFDTIPTPGTYVLSFVKVGYSADPVSLQIEPGVAPPSQRIVMAAGTDTITGRVFAGTDKSGLGNVTVSLGGAPTVPMTTTLTTASNGNLQGSYALTGLPSTGTYTLTFSADGYQPKTVPLDRVSGSNAPAPVVVTLVPSTGQLAGHVTVPTGRSNVGATISVTDGVNVRTTTTTDSSTNGAAGDWGLPAVTPGTYTVTATLLGYQPQVTVVTVTAGKVARVALSLTPDS